MQRCTVSIDVSDFIAHHLAGNILKRIKYSLVVCFISSHTQVLKLFPRKEEEDRTVLEEKIGGCSTIRSQLIDNWPPYRSLALRSLIEMVLIKEFRIVMPISLEEYEVALTYTIMKMEQQNTTSKEGVEVLQNIPFEDELLGKGQYTSKAYHMNSKIPPWLRNFAPAKALTVQEESWNAYPKSKTVLKCPIFSQCLLSIETVNKADNGCSENVHGLSDDQLAARKVEVIDITSVAKDYWSKVVVGSARVDFSTFKSHKTGRGPLLKGWKDTCHPVMTSYKLLVMHAPLWGIGRRLEEAMISGERSLFLECHRRCFAWIDEWFGMTMEEICELERQNGLLLKKKLQKTYPETSDEDKKKSPHDNKKIVENSNKW